MKEKKKCIGPDEGSSLTPSDNEGTSRDSQIKSVHFSLSFSWHWDKVRQHAPTIV